MKKCNNCGTKSCANNGKIGVPIGCNDYTPPMPQTNADRIRSMTDEELAIEETAKGGCPHDCETPYDLDTDCVRCWLDWLKQEVDNG